VPGGKDTKHTPPRLHLGKPIYETRGGEKLKLAGEKKSGKQLQLVGKRTEGSKKDTNRHEFAEERKKGRVYRREGNEILSNETWLAEKKGGGNEGNLFGGARGKRVCRVVGGGWGVVCSGLGGVPGGLGGFFLF